MGLAGAAVGGLAAIGLAALVGDGVLRAAYFRGDLADLTAAVTAAGLDWNGDVIGGGLANRP